MGQPVMQWQLLAKDPDEQARFYATVFGWTVDTNNALGYRAIRTEAGKGIDGGIWPAPPEGKAMVTLYIKVDDIDNAVEAACAHGASVVIPPQHLPDGDCMAVIVDPEGVPVGLFTGQE